MAHQELLHRQLLLNTFDQGSGAWQVSVLNLPKVEAAESQQSIAPLASFQPKTYTVCLRIWNFAGLGNVAEMTSKERES